jgi:hypothetical protein
MRGRHVGSLVAGAFGLVYVLVNTGPLPSAAAVPLRIGAVIVFVAVLVSLRRPPPQPAAGTPAQRAVVGPGYWLVVAVEVVALVAGLRVINGVLDAPQAGVAWISLVVGLHFVPLGFLFREPFFYWLAGAIAACGAIGLVLAVAGASKAPIAAISGVIPGALLLASGLWGARRSPPRETPVVAD